ncbi:hypothetical protein BX600DRAFT_512455 [Xylariales sp. PMI_506]|nr:hypothetical protein BX600DRAFT_512455 [Xylariales sp. PMI_506]
MAGFAAAKPTPALELDTAVLVPRSDASCSFDLSSTLQDEILFDGHVSAGVDLGVRLPNAKFEGSVGVSVGADFLLSPVLHFDLSGLSLYLELDLSASAAVEESIELMVSDSLAIDLSFLGYAETNIDIALALDLVLGLTAGVDLTGGVTVTLPVGAYLDINIATQAVADSNLDGLVADALGLSIGALVGGGASCDLSVGLRLRTLASIGAGVSISGLDVGAGVQAALWVDLVDYTAAIAGISSSVGASISESFNFEFGAAIGVDVDVSDVFDIDLTPSAIVTLTALPSATASLGVSASYTGSFAAGITGTVSVGAGSSIIATAAADAISASLTTSLSTGATVAASSLAVTPAGTYAASSAQAIPTTTVQSPCGRKA